MPNSVLSGMNSSGSVSTLSMEENTMVMSSEDSSSYPDDSELELGLGLSLGGGGGGGRPMAKANPPPPPAASPGSSSSSSSPVTKTSDNVRCGMKRTADSQVAGWPPIGNYRMNSLVNHAKSPATGGSASAVDKCKIVNTVVDKTNYRHDRSNNVAKEGGLLKKSMFVKVNLDGISIGRKVDLSAHSCYETLAHTLDHMFTLSAAVGQRQLNVEEQVVMAGTGRPAILLDGSSDFVLTYEDKEGDWMLVGDVPWEMFLSSVRRLRIRRTSEANRLAQRSHERKR